MNVNLKQTVCKPQAETKGVDMTPEQRQAIAELRLAGFLIVLWYPEELGGFDPAPLQEVVTQLGNEAIDQYISDSM